MSNVSGLHEGQRKEGQNNLRGDSPSPARRLSKSRSEVYSLALAEYLARHAPDRVTEAMDRVCAEVGDEADPFPVVAAQRILEHTDW